MLTATNGKDWRQHVDRVNQSTAQTNMVKSSKKSILLTKQLHTSKQYNGQRQTKHTNISLFIKATLIWRM